MLTGKTVVLGISGSIAAYKIAYLASALKKLHADVEVIMTENATQFITPVTFESLTGNKCLSHLCLLRLRTYQSLHRYQPRLLVRM